MRCEKHPVTGGFGVNSCPDCQEPVPVVGFLEWVKHPHRGSGHSKCDDCGANVRVGDWPFCGGDPTKHEPAPHFGDEPLVSYWDEHISPEGAYISTRGERRRLMSKGNLDYLDVSKKKRGKVYVCLGG